MLRESCLSVALCYEYVVFLNIADFILFCTYLLNFLVFLLVLSQKCLFSRMYVFEIWLKYGNNKKLTVTEQAELVFQDIRDALSIDESDKENIDFGELKS